MTGIMLVQSKVASPADEAAFNTWYDTVHIPEILSVEGFVSARRFAVGDGESYVAVYEIEGDVETAKANLAAARAAGRMTPPVGLRMDPPPIAQYLPLLSEHTA